MSTNRINLDESEVERGDPAMKIVGKQEEQPARIHRRLEEKPKVITLQTIMFDIECRMDELLPVVNEYHKLDLAYNALDRIKSAEEAQSRNRPEST